MLLFSREFGCVIFGLKELLCLCWLFLVVICVVNCFFVEDGMCRVGYMFRVVWVVFVVLLLLDRLCGFFLFCLL